jgi:hypothetical protein
VPAGLPMRPNTVAEYTTAFDFGALHKRDRSPSAYRPAVFDRQGRNLGYRIHMSAPFQRIERAPLLTIFGDHAARMAALMRAAPALVPRMMFSPRSAIHATGAFLHLAAEAAQPDDQVASTLLHQDPRALLLTAMPDAPVQLYRALARAGATVRSYSFYARLKALMGTSVAASLLQGELNEGRLEHAEALLNADPLVATLQDALPPSLQSIEAIDTVLKLLRAHEVTVENVVLPKDAGRAAVQRRLHRAMNRIQAPPPPFRIGLPFHMIESVGELLVVGRRFENCIGWGMFGSSHLLRLAAGISRYIVCEDGTMQAAVSSPAPRVWHIDECSGPENALIADEQRQVLVEAMTFAGLTVIRHSPARALSIIGYPKHDGVHRDLVDAPDYFYGGDPPELVGGRIDE